MVSNFEFLNREWSVLAQLGKQAEDYLYDDPVASLTKQRQFIETLIKVILTLEQVDLDRAVDLHQRIEELEQQGIIDRDMKFVFHGVRRSGNTAVHDNVGDTPTALVNLKRVFFLANWFMETYGPLDFQELEFRLPSKKTRIQESASEVLKLQKELALLKARQEEELTKQAKNFEEQILALKEQQSKQSEPETQQIRLERRERSKSYLRRHDLNEFDTRLMFIDDQLRQAGWEVDSENLDWRKGARPEKNKNRAISEVVLPNGDRADYGLFIGLDLVGLVEAKRYRKAISGDLEQAKGYARIVRTSDDYQVLGEFGNYRVPFLFATNGRPYQKQLETESGIWFWDTRQPKKASYALVSWHSPEDLKQKLIVEEDKADEALKQEPFPDFAGRYYQKAAVKAVEEGIRGKKRRLLLAMATGTGKTRLALSLMYRLIKTKRVRRVLFLVDRRSLGIQAADALKDTKIDQTAFASLYDVKEVTDQFVEETTRIHIATVQGMVRRLFYQEDEAKVPSVGTYDFIIVDEAHRGYTEDKEMSQEELLFQDEKDYVSQYRRVIDYFDATVLGLTATPALHTTEIFGAPIYTYSYQQAVIDGYLVDHEPPYKFETELSKNGIHFESQQEVDIWNDNAKTVDKAYLEDELDFSVEEFNKKVISESFNRAILSGLTQYIHPDNSDKTLIFAATDKHADMIVHLLKQIYQEQGQPVDDDAIMKITGVVKDVEQKIKQFKNEKYPNIVVTVDLLTTGIDVPQIENLVFMRRVRSRILYDQMLGRATRLCPDNQKESFKIFDAVHLYDFLEKVTDMKPVVVNPSQSISSVFDKALKSEDEEEFTYFKNELLAKLQRKKQGLGEAGLKDWQTIHKIDDVDAWLQSLKEMTKADLAKQEKLIEGLNSYRYLVNPVPIAHVEDKLISIERGYGEGNSKPGDYLNDFSQFIKDNVEKIEVLNMVVTRPRELTYQDLREIQLILKEKHFDERYLQEAWRQEKQEKVAADIISFIRQVALGERLVDHDTRIKLAMSKVYGMADWTPKQLKWLERIEKQLLVSSVLAPTAQQYFNEVGIWRKEGGYKRIQIEIEQIDEVVDILNTYLYQV